MNQKQNLEGVVVRKSTRLFEVLVGEQRYPCGLASSFTAGFGPDDAARQVSVGDAVTFSLLPDGSGKIVAVLPRQSKFARRSSTPWAGAQAHEQVIAANVDQVVIVVAAANPAPRWNMLDRTLVAAEAGDLAGVICINKIDLVQAADGSLPAEMAEVITDYRAIGYPVVLANALNSAGLDDLRAALRGRTSIFLGKSGVGKTTLLNGLLPGLERRTNDVSRGNMHRGRHTTTDIEMFPLNTGGVIVDTPGMRELGLWDIAGEDLAMYFPEMRPFLGKCRFGLDCAHNEEPGCAIRKAVMENFISPRRYKSYIRMKDDI